ncbi:MAG: hypothetical protein L6R39_005342 [Caloplaca ligustica]|nr:MAG: hypothetical protein L6R39_005342 [Caloplaca ligustica]
MKSLIISAFVGITSLGLLVQAAPAAANGLTAGLTSIDVKRSPQGETCWEAPDGQIHCAKSKRSPQDETCWEAPDGQIHCAKSKRSAQEEHCWEAPDGQIHCSYSKRSAQDEHCWEAPDGQIHCSLKKRDASPQDNQCWEAPDGQIHCIYSKRSAQEEHCWEAPDGQIHCSLKKRDASPQDNQCWEAPDGQIHCNLKERAASAAPVVALPPAPVANGTSRQCASWWTVVNLKGQSDPCLAALVSAQNITFAQFRKLNPDVNSTCTNLKVGYAYCIQAANSSFPDFASPSNNPSTAAPAPSSAPAPLPAIRVTEARSGLRGPSTATPTVVAQSNPEVPSTAVIPDVTATPQPLPSALVTTSKPPSQVPRPVTIKISDQPFFTVTYLDEEPNQATRTASVPSTSQVDATNSTSEFGTAPYSTNSFSQPTPPPSSGTLRSGAEDADVGAPKDMTTFAQSTPLSQFGPKVTDQV